GSNFDNVQLNNGNLHIELPLWSYSGRGLPTKVKYVYDNKGWYLFTTCGHMGACSDTTRRESGNNQILRLATPLGYVATQKNVTQACAPGNPQLTVASRVLREPDGTKHHMLPDPAFNGFSTCCGDVNAPAYAEDGSGWAYIGGQIYRKDGTLVGTLKIEDTNGNQILADSTTGVITDTLG